jgi:hypothetical protein
MPVRPDDAPRLRGSRLCEITGVIRQTRDKWAQRGLLRSADDYDQFDLVELAVLKLLFDSLKKSHVTIAWARVRPNLREVMPGPQLTLVWDPQRRSAELSFDADEIVALARHGRPVHVLDLGSAVEWAREAFRREVEAATTVRDGAGAGGAETTRRTARDSS